MKRKIKEFLAPSDHPHSLGSKFRSKRFKFFEDSFIATFKADEHVRILDVGGTESFWIGKDFLKKRNVSITLLNLEKQEISNENLESIAGDATDLSSFENNSFDLVFSNSVIEHLYNLENQKKMAREIQRVGKKYFVQTPNRYFFLEPHYALPFFQFLPAKIGYFILTKTKLSRMQKWDPDQAKEYLQEIRLLSVKEMRMLFPNANIYYEKFLGMDKSFVFHNFG